MGGSVNRQEIKGQNVYWESVLGCFPSLPPPLPAVFTSLTCNSIFLHLYVFLSYSCVLYPSLPPPFSDSPVLPSVSPASVPRCIFLPSFLPVPPPFFFSFYSCFPHYLFISSFTSSLFTPPTPHSLFLYPPVLHSPSLLPMLPSTLHCLLSLPSHLP